MFTDNRCAKISANNIHGENNKYPLPQKYWLPFSMTKKLPVVIVPEDSQEQVRKIIGQRCSLIKYLAVSCQNEV